MTGICPLYRAHVLNRIRREAVVANLTIYAIPSPWDLILEWIEIFRECGERRCRGNNMM